MVETRNLNNLTWAEIGDVGRRGQARSLFGIGATKDLKNRSGRKIATMQIVDFNKDLIENSNDKACISWIALFTNLKKCVNDFIPSSQRPNYTHVYPFDGWPKSDLREYLNGYLITQFPDDLRQAIKPVVKRTALGAQTCITIDRVWIPSVSEVMQQNSKDTETYERFQFINCNERRVNSRSYRPNQIGDSYWLRSSIESQNRKTHDYNEAFWMMYGSGWTGIETPTKELAIAIGFCT